MATINDLVNEALARWVALTGLAVNDGQRVVAWNCPWQSYDVERQTEALNESRTLDPTGLTTFMLVRGLAEAYLHDIQFNAHDLILNPGSIETQLKPMRALRDLLEEPEVVQLIASFQKQVRDGAGHYGVESGEPMDKIETLLGERYRLARVRRDALLSMQRLDAHQFTQGAKDDQPLKYSPEVFEFWNVNSLLAAMRGQKCGGISLCLLRDPELPLRSYFVFAVRNGGTLTVLTDKSKEPHPAYKRMARRPDRELDSRASQHWFPYQLLDLTLTAEERVVASARTQLVPINVEAVPLTTLAKLEPEQFVWVMLVFDLIRERFWSQDVKLPKLSYTGQMIVEPQALVGVHGALVKDGLYKPLELPPLVAEDVTDKTLRPQWQHEPTHFNGWLVNRYRAQVPNEVLSPVGDQAKLLLEGKSKEPGFLPTAMVRPTALEGGFRGSHLVDRWNGKDTVKFETMDATAFGTKKDLVKDRLWVARMNQCAVIQELANAEFVNEKDRVCDWYMAAIRKNKRKIFDACARGEWVLPTWTTRDWGGTDMSQKNAVTQWTSKKWWGGRRRTPFHFGKAARFGGRDGFPCAEQPTRHASIFTEIHVSCPQAIAVVCGVDVETLPWPLQHWYDKAPYDGNPILQRLDPADWKLENPWLKIDFSVSVTHSKTAYQARREALGLARMDVSTLPVRD